MFKNGKIVYVENPKELTEKTHKPLETELGSTGGAMKKT